MPPSPVPVDKYGFPLPRKLSDQRPLRPAPPRSAPAWLRLAAGILLVLIVAAIALGALWRGGAGRGVAQWRLEKARARYLQGDLAAAQRLADQAVTAAPNDPGVTLFRAQLRLEAGDLAGSLHDLNRALAAYPRFGHAYTIRSRVYQRLSRHAEAIRDATQALAMSRDDDPDPWNERAYVRAIAGMELEEGLDDVQRAIELYGAPNSAYLDTRGYLYHLLGRQQEALEDLNAAIQLAEREDPWRMAFERRPLERRRIDHERRRRDENLSVLYHHRGQVLAALGRADEAQADLARAEDLGYNPAAGVY